jgi:hypothetical protein
MAGKTFLDELAILNSQDFGGGLAEIGKAMKEQMQNENLHSLWQEFQLRKKGLSTTGEQINQLNKEYDSKTDKNGFITKGAPPSGKVKEDAQASINLYGYLQKQKAYLGTYEPFIQAFLLTGEDGVNIAKSLTDELGNKLAMLDKESQIPFMELEYKSILQKYNHDKDTIDVWHKAVDRETRLRNVQDAALSHPFWKKIHKLKANFNTSAGRGEILAYDETVRLLEEEIGKKFPDINPDDIGIAVQSAITQFDKGLYTEELDSGIYGSGGGKKNYDPFTIDMAGSFAQEFTAEFNSLGDGLKEAMRIYSQDGYIPTKVVNPKTGKDEEVDKNRVLGLLERANQFMKAQDVLNYESKYKWFDKVEEEIDFGVDGKGNPKTIKMETPTIKLRGGSTGNIMRVKTLPDLLNMRFDYNPYQKQNILSQQKKKKKEMDDANVYQGEERDFPSEVVDFLYDDVPLGTILVDAPESIISEFWEGITRQRLKTTKEIRRKKR